MPSPQSASAFKYTAIATGSNAGVACNKSPCVLGKVLCTASSSDTLTVYDGTSASGIKVINVMPMVAGTVYDLDIALQAGCFIVPTATFAGVVLIA
jgi:hypothetical protein